MSRGAKVSRSCPKFGPRNDAFTGYLLLDCGDLSSKNTAAIKDELFIPLVLTYVEDMTFPAEDRHRSTPDTCLTFDDWPKT